MKHWNWKQGAALVIGCGLILGAFTGCGTATEPAAQTTQTTQVAEVPASLPQSPDSQAAPSEVPANPREDQPSEQPQGQLPQGQPPELPQGGAMTGDLQVGQITAIEGQTVTLVRGSLSFPQGGGPMSQAPEGGAEQAPFQGGQGMPQGPDGRGQMDRPLQPADDQMGQMPSPPQGEDPFQGSQDASGAVGEAMLGGRGFGGRGTREGFDLSQGFTAGTETLTLTVDETTADSLSVGDVVRLVTDEEGTVTGVQALGDFGPGAMGGRTEGMGRQDFQGREGFGPGGGFDGMQGGSAGSTGTAANTAAQDLTGQSLTSDSADENALRAEGSTVTLTDLTLTKTGDSSDTESSDFYGMNAGLLATDGAQVTVQGGSFTTDGAGANALFSYGEGTALTVEDAVIRTAGRNSGGIQTAGGGSTTAKNLDVETKGASSAAIRSDRGGGTVTVTGGSYVTKGTGSPAVYSTAEITVSDATLTAQASEAIVVEGKNSVTLNNCRVSGSMTGTYGEGSGENLQGVMIYQSMSGDANVGKGSFSMTGGSLTTTAGDLFYVTNTSASISLENTALTAANGVLLRAAGNDGSRGWGTQGSNGGKVTLTARNQVLEGEILVDDISSLELTLGQGSVFTGTVNPEGSAGRVRVVLEAGASWTLTEDAWITALTGDPASVDLNGHTLYVNGQPMA